MDLLRKTILKLKRVGFEINSQCSLLCSVFQCSLSLSLPLIRNVLSLILGAMLVFILPCQHFVLYLSIDYGYFTVLLFVVISIQRDVGHVV